MGIVLTDSEIANLLAEKKLLPPDYRRRIVVKPKRGHKESELAVRGVNGSEFRLVLRQANANPLDFSVILSFQLANSNQEFRLRRYNGKSHEHTNTIESQTFYDFHRHEATQRYQEAGFKEDAFGEPTGRYADLTGAIECMVRECGFERPPGDQCDLFALQE